MRHEDAVTRPLLVGPKGRGVIWDPGQPPPKPPPPNPIRFCEGKMKFIEKARNWRLILDTVREKITQGKYPPPKNCPKKSHQKSRIFW